MMLPITESYVQLKIDELQVTHEHREHKKQERDRLAEQQAQLSRQQAQFAQQQAQYARQQYELQAQHQRVVGSNPSASTITFNGSPSAPMAQI